MRKHDIVEKAAKYIKGHRREHRRHYFLRGVSAIVVFCTVYSLILPAISMEQKTYCGLGEHKHSEACYESRLICGYTEAGAAETLSTPTETLSTPTETLSATAAAGETLSDTTVAGETQPEATGMGEATAPVQAHVHTDACYEQVLTCEKQEHTHALSCYADPNADVESADAWARSVSGVALSGNWGEDVAAVAASQLGYRESEKNYQVAEDGVTIKGYTRYGDWSGDRYGDWNAMFVSFCLNYAGIPKSAFPRETNCSRWVRALTQRGLYHASDYEPVRGDLVFFDKDGDGTSDRVALITGTTKDESGHVTQLSTVEGDSSNCVQRGSYSIDESTISGFAALPENPNTPAETVPAETTPVETVPVETVPTVEVTKPATTAPTIAQAELPVESVHPSADIQAEGDPTLELKLGETLNVTVSVGETVKIPFTPEYTHEYVFQSTGSGDTYGHLYDASGKQITYNDDGAGNGQFKITYTLTAGTLYYFGVRYYSSSNSGTIPVLLTWGTHQYTENDEGTLVCGCGQVIRAVSALEVDKQMDVTAAKKETVRIPFTPSYTHEYVFTASGSADIRVDLYNASGSRITGSSGANASITYDMTAGTTYYFDVTSSSGAALGTIPVRLTRGMHKITKNDAGEFICVCGERALTGLELDTQMDVDVAAGKTVMIQFTPEYTHEYVFQSTGSGDTYGYLYNANGGQITSNDNGASNKQFKITYNLTAGTTYFFGVKYVSASASGTIPVLLTLGKHVYNENDAGEFICVCGERALTGLELDTQMDVDVAAGKTVMIQFTPEYTHEYVFQSTGSGDTYGYLYNANGGQITSNDNGASNKQFKITYNLTAGTTYFFGVKYVSASASGTIPVLLTLGKHVYNENEAGDRICTCGQVLRTVSVELDKQTDVTVAEKETVRIPFTPEFTHEYVFTASGSADASVALYNASGSRITGSSGANASITYNLTAGTNYYFDVTSSSGAASGTISVLLTKGMRKFKDSGTGVLICDCGADMSSGLELNKEVRVEVSAGQEVKIPFTPTYTHEYVFQSTFTDSYDTYGYLYDASGAEITHDDNSGSSYNFKITYTLTAGTTYYYGVKYQYSGSGTIPVLLTQGETHKYEKNAAGDMICACGLVHTPLSSLVLDKQTDVAVAAGEIAMMPFTPTFTHEYVFQSTGSEAIYSYLYDADGNQLAGQEGATTYTLKGGMTYYYTVRYADDAASGTIPVLVTMGAHAYSKKHAEEALCTCGVLIKGLELNKVLNIEVAAGQTVQISFKSEFAHDYRLEFVRDENVGISIIGGGNAYISDDYASIWMNPGNTCTISIYFKSSTISGTIPVLLSMVNKHSYQMNDALEYVCACGEEAKEIELAMNQEKEVTLREGEAVLASFTPEVSHTYTLSCDASGSFDIVLYDSAGKALKSSKSANGISYRLTAGATYYYGVSYSYSRSGTVKLGIAYNEHQYAENEAGEAVCADCGEKLPARKCGDDLWWSYTGGVLTITGTGEMYSYAQSNGNPLPWESIRGSIKSVVIEPGATSIGDSAFHNCDSLTSVSIPDSVTSIGDSAFYNCASLTSVSIPDSVTSIGEEAFRFCRSLASVSIPNSVTSIGEFAFSHCESLTSVSIPNSVTSIERYMFSACRSLISLSIPDSVTSIGEYAFWCSDSLTSVSIPDGVTSIGKEAFYGCAYLTSLSIPNSVTSIGELAICDCDSFETLYWNARGPVSVASQGCIRKSITIVIGKDVDVLTNDNIAQFVRMGCGKIEFEHPNYITLPQMKAEFTDVPLSNLPEGRYYIDESGIFYRISEGKAYVAYCPAETENATIPASIPAEDGGDPIPVVGVDSHAFRQATVSELTFEKPENITVLSNYAFYGAENLAAINGKRTAEEILNVLTPAKAGMQLFTHTKITDGGITDAPLTTEKLDLKLTIVTAPGKMHTPAQGEDGSFLYYTGEGAETTITVSNPESGVTDSGDAIRIYFSFNTKNGTINYKPGHYDLIAKSGAKCGMDVFETDVPGCYCLELQRPAQGDTVSFIVTSQYPSPTSGGGSATVWGGILTDEEKAALGTGLLTPDSFHMLSWDTRADDFPVTKTSNSYPTMYGDGNGSGLVGGLSYTIEMSRTGSTLEGIGKDHVASVDFVDTLILPEGAALSEKVVAAIRDKTYKLKWDNFSTNYKYLYCLPDGSQFMRTKIKIKSLAVNEQGQLVISWKEWNSNLGTEISNTSFHVEICYGAVVIPHPEEGKTYTITNHVAATQHYMYSEDRVKEASASGAVTISAGRLSLSKSGKNLGSDHYGAEKEFTITAQNPGVMPYERLARLEDPIPSDYYLSAAQMAALLADDPEHDLTITISSATLCTTGEGKTVTGIDGTSQAVTDLSNTGANTSHSGTSATDPDCIKEDAVITLAWAGENQIQITVDDGAPQLCAPTAEAIQGYLDSIGFLVTPSCRYKLVWGLTDEAGNARTLIGGEKIKKRFVATVKDTFMRLNADKLNVLVGDNASYNYVYAYDKAGEQITSANDSYSYYRLDYALYKNWSFDGQTIDTDTELAQGSVLDYVLTASHSGSGSRDVLPLVDHLFGAQVLLAPKELNKDMDWAADCPTVTVGETEYYFLSKEGTYSHVWTSETQMADSVAVKKTVTGFDTLIKWYFMNYTGDRTDTVPYKAMVCPEELAPGALTYSVSNESWLNDHESHRLYATITGWSGVNFNFDKKIVEHVGDTAPGKSYSVVHEGEDIVYRLTLYSNVDEDGNYLPLTLTGNAIYDTLPGSIADYRWTKSNVKIDYGDGYTVKNGDHWDVYDQTSDTQHIRWDSDFSITFTGEAHIYVTLTYPSGTNWQNYAVRYGTEVLVNTFHVFNNYVSVTHELGLSGAVRLQKGVYASGETPLYDSDYKCYYVSNDQPDDRLHYQGDGVVRYYLTLYNGGKGRLYLTELWDRLPRGFTILDLSRGYHYYWSRVATVYNGVGTEMQRAAMTCTYTTKMEADGTQLVCFRFSEKPGSNNIHYDAGRGMYYLKPGEYIMLDYVCWIGDAADTDVKARNIISMPYYDYTGTGVTVDTGSRTVVDDAKKYTPNDGGCYLETNGQAQSHGFTGGTSDTQWLTSDVTVTREDIKPGITKALTSATDANGLVTQNPVSAHSMDTLTWTVTAENDSTNRISDYVLTDVMPYPYMFTGKVSYYTSASNSHDTLFTIVKTEDPDKLTIRVGSSPVTLTIGGEPVELQCRGGNRYYSVWLSISRDENQNAVMSIRLLSDYYAIPGGGKGVLTLQTKNTTTEVTNKQYLNTCYITPMVQTWDNTTNKGNMTELKTPFSEEALPSVRNSAPVTTSYGYTTSSIKRVTEVGNASNTATSTGNPNYIILDSAKNLFTYTASVDNSTPNAMDKLIMIDSLPEPGDHTVFLENDPRFSAFKVSLADEPNFAVTVTDEAGTTTTLDPTSYKVEFSTKTTFDAGDWNGSSTWDSSQSEARSIRLVILDDAGTLIPAKSTVSLHFTCKVDGEANPGTIAWNSFGYHYSLTGEDAELEAAPLKVGVKLPGVPKLKKQIVDHAGYEVPAEQDKTFSFLLYEGEALETSYDTEAALTQALTDAGRAYKKYELTVPAGQSCSESVFLRTTGWEWTNGLEWVNGQTYTLVELPTEEEYAFGKFDTSTNPAYSFTYNKAEEVITCENTDLRWDVELTKVNTKGELLEGAVFALYSPVQADKIAIPSEYSSLNVETEITRDGRKWYLKAINTTPADGKLSWEDLIREQYYLVEIKAPDGYNQPTGDGWLLECKNVERNVCKITVTNTSSHELPMTGGSGTTPYTAGGALLMSCAGMLLLYSKKKRRKEDSASS